VERGRKDKKGGIKKRKEEKGIWGFGMDGWMGSFYLLATRDGKRKEFVWPCGAFFGRSADLT
jgi:hypothetical protein